MERQGNLVMENCCIVCPTCPVCRDDVFLPTTDSKFKDTEMRAGAACRLVYFPHCIFCLLLTARPCPSITDKKWVVIQGTLTWVSLCWASVIGAAEKGDRPCQDRQWQGWGTPAWSQISSLLLSSWTPFIPFHFVSLPSLNCPSVISTHRFSYSLYFLSLLHLPLTSFYNFLAPASLLSILTRFFSLHLTHFHLHFISFGFATSLLVHFIYHSSYSLLLSVF